MTAPAPLDLPALLDDLERAHAAATPGPWAQHPAAPSDVIGDISDDGESYLDVADTGDADAALIVAAVNALPKLTAALHNVLSGCDHLDRMRPTFSSAEARMAYADATKHIRACLTAALSPKSVQP